MNHDSPGAAVAVGGASWPRRLGQRLVRLLSYIHGGWRGAVAVLGFVLLWQAFGMASGLLGGKIPTPIDVFETFVDTFAADPRYWQNWAASFERVLWGFGYAQVLGIPLGIALGLSRTTEEIVFPVFEVLRPIPPLAWVPIAILFWPTHEASIIFITFIGAFFVIVINVFDGIKNIPVRYFWLATSLGATRWQIFLRIVLPAVIPSVAVGMTLGIAITWDVLVAAEMIAGDLGLGRLTWEGYVSNTPTIVVVGMISIGIAGYASARLVDYIEGRLMPWAQHDPKFQRRR
jgi:NitT/TauT family transport system permease protein